MEFSKNVKRLRREQGLTQKQLADLLGISKVSVHLWESGKNDISGESLKRLSKTLNVTIDELLGIEPLPNTTTEITEILAIINKLSKKDKQICLAFLKCFLEQKKFIQNDKVIK